MSQFVRGVDSLTVDPSEVLRKTEDLTGTNVGRFGARKATTAQWHLHVRFEVLSGYSAQKRARPMKKRSGMKRPVICLNSRPAKRMSE